MEGGEDGGVEGGSGGDGGLGGRFPVPAGEAAAGAFDDGDEGEEVPGAEDGIEHDVGASGGDEEVAVAIPPGAEESGAAAQGFKGLVVLMAFDGGGVGAEDGGAFEGDALADADGAAVEGGGAAAAEAHFLKDGLVDAAGDGAAAVEQADEDAEEGDTGDKGFGAVDRIEDPDEFGIGAVGTEFLAEDAVVGVVFGDEGAHDFLGPAVGDGDGGEVGFFFHCEVRVAEVGEDGLAGGAGEGFKEEEGGRELHGGEAMGPQARRAASGE